MKTILLTMALASLFLTSCQPKDDVPLNAKPIPQYMLMLEVVDQNGANVLADMSVGSFENASAEAHFAGENRPAKECRTLYKALLQEVSYLAFSVIGYHREEDIPQVTWKMKCKEVFGDQEVHQIVSKWFKDGDNSFRHCTSIEFEGKTYTPVLKEGFWTVRVVVNR